MRIRARHYATGRLVDIVCEKGVIRSVADASRDRPDHEAGWVSPAFFDLQINGCDGHSFNSEKLTREQIHHVVQVCRKHGIGGFLPTLVTTSQRALVHGMTTLRQACANDPEIAYAIAGIHLEGPYISPEDGPRGAHPLAHVRPADWDEFQELQEAAGGRIRLVTLAPEVPGALHLIERLVQAGVTVALGHTAASPGQIRDAVVAGARLSTHLGNGSHALLPRHENYFLEQLASDKLWASLICDGQHLPAGLVSIIERVKTPARLILTCDAGPLAGCPPGRYRMWDQDFDVVAVGPSTECKIVVAASGFLAGSWAFTDLCVGNFIEFTHCTLAQAVDMASAQPRSLLGLPPRSMETGHPADLLLFDWQPGGAFVVKETIQSSMS
ncbi:MAG: amidohydrolase family protein [Gemmataceae bacterium]|nr:amidohydrolase family protein [Gemmataceae bacterium]MCI0739560.1 amidohydrolase family protein [Gemmataceae bacterium]